MGGRDQSVALVCAARRELTERSDGRLPKERRRREEEEEAKEGRRKAGDLRRGVGDRDRTIAKGDGKGLKAFLEMGKRGATADLLARLCGGGGRH
jgi:hypothetical protein